MLTVVRGLMLASLRVCSIASIDGLHGIRDFGSSTPGADQPNASVSKFLVVFSQEIINLLEGNFMLECAGTS